MFARNTLALVDGAALHLSNMENFEWSTQAAWFDDGELSGPVVNSRRQLWSVAGYLALWLRGVAGLELDEDGLHIDPFLPCPLADDLALGDAITLSDLPVAGRRITLTLNLPADRSCDALGLDTLTVDGTTVAGPIPLDALPDGATVVATLGRIVATPGLTEASVTVAPRPPVLGGVAGGALSFTTEPGTTVTVFRDGEAVATGLSGTSWVDPSPADADTTACYSIVAVDAEGQTGHRSPVQCDWGPGRVQVFDAHDLVVGDGRWATEHGRPHIGDWGQADHTLELLFRPDTTGRHLLQVVYSNGSGPASTGITAGHKHVLVDIADGEAGGLPVADRAVVLPHTGGWDVWQESTAVGLFLDAGTTYRLTLSDLPNMTALDHFTPYTGGLGGGDATHNAVNIAEIKLLALSGPTSERPGDTVPLDGADDLDKFASVEAVGVPRQPWEAFAIEVDDDFVYLAWVTEAAEDPLLPAMLYLEADPVGAPVPSEGMATLGHTPDLPFTPTHAITLRSVSDAHDGAGPWSGVWAREGGRWVQHARLRESEGAWVAADRHTLSARVPRWLLGDPASVRIAGHVVNAAPGEEWKTTVPPGHVPWDGGGDYLEQSW